LDRSWAGPRASLDAVEKRKILPLLGIEPPVIQQNLCFIYLVCINNTNSANSLVVQQIMWVYNMNMVYHIKKMFLKVIPPIDYQWQVIDYMMLLKAEVD
jgi:hypothetical protein